MDYLLPVPALSIRKMKLQEVHDGSGHYGIQVTQEQMNVQYWWPNVEKDVIHYVKACHSCQVFNRNNPVQRPLNPITVNGLFDLWGLDFIGPLPLSRKGNRYILVATEYYTRWPVAIPTAKQDAITVASFLYEHIFTHYGPPSKILTDRGSPFRNSLIREFTEKCRVNHQFTTAYNPRCNGLTERFNKTLIASLEKITYGDELNWDGYIPGALWNYRTKIHSTVKQTPYKILYGVEIKYPLTYYPSTEENRIDVMQQVRQDVLLLDKFKKEQMKFRYDTNVKLTSPYIVGNMVLLYNSKLNNSHSKKFKPRWTGPYIISDILPSGNLILKEPRTGQSLASVNINRVTRYCAYTPTQGNCQ